MKSPLKYIGSKNIDLSEYEIDKYKIYCEPFGGGFNTGLRLIENGFTGKVIYNDLDGKVVNFWNCLKTNYDELVKEIHKLNNILKEYLTDEERNRTIDLWSKSNRKIKKAAAEYLHRQYSTMNGRNYSKLDNEINDCDIYLNSILLDKVDIRCNSALDIIQDINDVDTFLLVDPPYICDNIDKYYRCESSKFSHEKLYKLLKDFNGKWLLTYNDCDSIRELYKDFNIEVKTRSLGFRQYSELYITN